MKINTKKKGQRKELLCSKELEASGWRVVFRGVTVKQGPIFKGHDFADCIDVVAVKQLPYLTYLGERITTGIVWVFISCTHRGHISEKKTALKEFADVFRLPLMSFEVWAWDKARWVGRGKNKYWKPANWIKEAV